MGGGRGGRARGSEFFFYKESNLKKYIFFWGGEGGEKEVGGVGG